MSELDLDEIERLVAKCGDENPLIRGTIPALVAEVRQLRREYDQIASTASSVYCEITGGLLSYPTYDARTILSYYEDDIRKMIDDETAVVVAERDAAVSEADELRRQLSDGAS